MTLPPYLEEKKSPLHGMGLFATHDIRKGTYVIEYVGERIDKDESQDRYDERYKLFEQNKGEYPGTFLFELDDDFDIDGDVEWNPARWINHSCDPNCETDIHGGKIWIIAIRDIKKGEELFYNYGFDLDDAEDHPCWCDSPKCVGYIVDEDHWPQLKKKIQKGKLPKPEHAKGLNKI